MTGMDTALKKNMEEINSFYKGQSQHREDLVYFSNYDVVLKEGQFFTPAERPANITKGKDKDCYRNAGLLACNSDYIYVEGFAISKNIPIPLPHAWVVTKEGVVIDPTWKTAGDSYYGVMFSTKFLFQTTYKTGVWGLIPEIPTKKYNPYKNGFPKGVIVK